MRLQRANSSTVEEISIFHGLIANYRCKSDAGIVNSQTQKQQSGIAQKGTRPTQQGQDFALYELTLRGQELCKQRKKSIDTFLQSIKDKQLLFLIASLYRVSLL